MIKIKSYSNFQTWQQLRRFYEAFNCFEFVTKSKSYYIFVDRYYKMDLDTAQGEVKIFFWSKLLFKNRVIKSYTSRTELLDVEFVLKYNKKDKGQN